MEPIIHALIFVAVVGLLCGLAITYIPMPPPFKQIVIGVAVIGTVLYLLNVFGIFHLAAH